MERFIKKKKFGQNFLKDTRVCEKMVLAGKVTTKDIVLEVGPGEGVLTAYLLKKGATVFAIEKDRELLPILKEKFKKEIKAKKLVLVEGDIRDIKLSSLGLKNEGYKVIANIPYYISGLLFRFFLENKLQPNTVVFLVQKEVGERITTKDRKESLLSLSVKAFGTPLYISTVKRGAFSPAPKVDSAVIAIENISRKKFVNKKQEQKFFELAKKAFNTSRKQLGHIFKNEKKAREAFSKIGVDLRKRPEDILLEEWLSVAK